MKKYEAVIETEKGNKTVKVMLNERTAEILEVFYSRVLENNRKAGTNGFIGEREQGRNWQDEKE